MMDDFVEALLATAESGETTDAAEAMASAIDGCAGLHCTFTTFTGIRRQISYVRTPREVGDRLMSAEFQRPETNPIARGFPNLLPGRMTPFERFVDMKALHDSQLFQELIEPYHTPNLSSMVIPGRFGYLAFGVGQEAGVLPESLHTAERMAFHVARALDLFAMSQSPGEGAFLVDIAGHLAGSPDLAIRRLSRGTLHVARPGAPVVPVARSMTTEFFALLNRAGRGLAGSIVLPDSEGLPVRLNLTPGPNFRRREVVWIHAETLGGPSWSAAALTAVHKLTPREAAVVAELLTGADVPSIAERHGLSQRSVRTYLSGAYAKTGTVGQASLMAYLLNF